jgi:peptide/nickel transport system permease protein
VWLLTATLVITLASTAALSVLAARRPGGLGDITVQGFTLVGLTMPSFWVGIVLLIAVAVPTGWFPIGGWADTTVDRSRAIVLPALTLSLAITPILVRSLRASLIETAASDQVVAARSLGIEGWRLTRWYVLRNAIPPTFALLVSLSGFLLSGTVLVEQTFGIPGLGQTMIRAAIQRDLNVIQGLTLVFAVAVVGLNLLGDLALAALDPRVELR